MTLEEIKAQARTTFTAPTSGMVFTIRKLSFIEVQEANLNAILGVADLDMTDEEQPPEEVDPKKTLRAVVQGDRMLLAATRFLLVNGVVSPRIGFWEEHRTPVPDGAVDASWIKDDLAAIADAVGHFSNLTREADEKMGEFSKNESALGSSTT